MVPAPHQRKHLRGILKVPGFENAYLVVARAVDPKALEFPKQAQEAANYYEALSQRKIDVQVAFASMYALISLILLLSAVWFGLSFANRFVSPIRRLIYATDQVASGNFYVQVPSRKDEGDLGHLAETFNKMTSELRQQHDRLTPRAISSIAGGASRRRCFRAYRRASSPWTQRAGSL